MYYLFVREGECDEYLNVVYGCYGDGSFGDEVWCYC